jgi:ferredoxin-NADP reductase/uncharacterized protein YcbX
VPRLVRISIYPVKSLDPFSTPQARVLASGALADDRRFALFDQQGQFVNGKRNPRVHLLRSSFKPATRQLKLSGGQQSEARWFHIDADRDSLDQWLTDFFGFPVELRENLALGFPDDTDSPGPTLISTATLRTVGEWFGLSLEQARARFRCNLEIDGVEPFWEDRLYAEKGEAVRFSIGKVVFDGINPCQRCVVPARDPATGAELPEFARRFAELRGQHLPQWANRARFNHFYRLAINTRLVSTAPRQHVSVGDELRLLETVGASAVATVAIDTRPTQWNGELRIAEIIKETPSVRTFRLCAVDSSEIPFTHAPGQFLNLEIEHEAAVLRRCYTISSSPTQRGFCDITVKREPAGRVSPLLHDSLQVGDRLRVTAPSGRFVFTGEEAVGIALIGAGVGITPLMAVIRYLADRNWPGAIDLLYSAKTSADIIFKSELDQLQQRMANFRCHITLTQSGDESWTGLRGRIDCDLIRQCLPGIRQQRVHVCGPVEMTARLKEMLGEVGVPASQIKSESFGGGATAPAANGSSNGATNGMTHGGAAASVTFALSGRSVGIYFGQTLLDASTLANVPIDRGCLAGVCGRCKVRLLSGEVDASDEGGLCDEEKRAGFVLSCQCKPRGNVAVEA